MSAWLPGLLIALLLGIAASLYLWLVRRRDEENAAGLHALAGMRWREFARLVLAAMERRGYRQISAGPEDVREQSASFLLGKDDRQLLLACKHGSAYRIGSATVDEIASDIRLRGAQGGILVTQGILDQGGRDKAARHDIEVLDGTRLWPELKPLVDDNLRKHVVDDTTAHAGRHIGFAWLAAIAVGAAVALLLPGSSDEADANASAAAPAPATAAQAQPAMPATQPPIASVAAPPSEEQLEKERAEVAKSMAGIDGLVRGIWISRSTLAVDRKVGEDLAWSLVCTELARHPNLALTRVQMNPPPGSDEQVRWRQCESIRR